jgi:hypothetical protein
LKIKTVGFKCGKLTPTANRAVEIEFAEPPLQDMITAVSCERIGLAVANVLMKPSDFVSIRRVDD